MNSETTWTFFSIILQLLDFILAQICLRLFYLLNWVFLKTKQTFAEISARNEKKLLNWRDLYSTRENEIWHKNCRAATANLSQARPSPFWTGCFLQDCFLQKFWNCQFRTKYQYWVQKSLSNWANYLLHILISIKYLQNGTTYRNMKSASNDCKTLRFSGNCANKRFFQLFKEVRKCSKLWYK